MIRNNFQTDKARSSHQMILREGRSPAPVNNRALRAMQMQTNKAKRMPPSVSCDRPVAHGCRAQQLREAPLRAQRDRFSARPSARGGCSPRLLLQCGGPAAPGYVLHCMQVWRRCWGTGGLYCTICAPIVGPRGEICGRDDLHRMR